MTSIVAAALWRAVFRLVDGLALLGQPRLWRAWWVGWRARPSPYRADFAVALDAQARGLGVGDLVYGEAFVVVARAILRAHGVDRGSVVVDLGCGRGAVLVAARSLGAAAHGVEIARPHVDAVATVLRDAGATVVVDDARTVDLAGATHVWLSWATWSPQARARVTAALRALPDGAVVVGVVHGVDDDGFVVVARARAPFSWGVADVVVARRVVARAATEAGGAPVERATA
jgi:hypothetical protein